MSLFLNENNKVYFIDKGKKIEVSPCFKELYEKLQKTPIDQRSQEFNKLIKLKDPCATAGEYTLQEISLLFNISKERVRQIHDVAIKKLKHPKNAKKLREYILYS
jgi:RNA polymerase primary sigma factor